MTIKPYKNSNENKKTQVAAMFNSIAKRYDFLNHFLSLGIDITWRQRVIKKLAAKQPQIILDVATGTADMAIALTKLKPQKIYGIDISANMLEVGKKKIANKQLENIIQLSLADSEALPFEDNTFDTITSAFGVRNFEHLEKGLAEMYRTMKNGGSLAILEFSKPKTFPIKQLYHFYFNLLLPLFGRFISKDKAAYNYLPKSVDAFPEGKAFLEILEKIGFKATQQTPLSFGIASIYTATKK